MASELLDLIDADPAVVRGPARFRGTTIPVSVVLDCLAADMSEAEIRSEYPTLPPEAIRAAIAYAADLVRRDLSELDAADQAWLDTRVEQYRDSLAYLREH